MLRIQPVRVYYMIFLRSKESYIARQWICHVVRIWENYHIFSKTGLFSRHQLYDIRQPTY